MPATRRDETFDLWCRTYGARLLACSLRMLGDRAAAEDVMQETLLRAWVRREQLADPDDIWPWLWRVARNLCLDVLRARGRVVPAAELPDGPDECAPDPIASVEAEEDRRALRAAVSRLSERHRRLIELREVDGLEYAELGLRVGLTPEGARSVLFRARRQLREHLLAGGVGTFGVVPVVRGRVGSAWRRLKAAGYGIEHAGAWSLNAGVTLLVGTGLALSSAAGLAPLASITGGAPAAAVVQPPERRMAVTAAPATPQPVPPARDPVVRAALDDGGVAVRGSVPNPLSGDEEPVWVRIWRQQGTQPSPVTQEAERLAVAACDEAAAACARADEASGEELTFG